jgi:hypothetical protein
MREASLKSSVLEKDNYTMWDKKNEVRRNDETGTNFFMVGNDVCIKTFTLNPTTELSFTALTIFLFRFKTFSYQIL